MVLHTHVRALFDEQHGYGRVTLAGCKEQRRAGGRIFLINICSFGNRLLDLIDIAGFNGFVQWSRQSWQATGEKGGSDHYGR